MTEVAVAAASAAAAAAFLAALALLIAVHEWGHYRVARACGVKVLRFSIGFGRVIWRRVGRDGTEFTLSALPLGGYVRMLDERDGTVAPHEREQAWCHPACVLHTLIEVRVPLLSLF